MTFLKSRPVCVMVGPGIDAKGGMSSVVLAYDKAGLFGDGRVVMLPSYHPGRFDEKMAMALKAVIAYVCILLCGVAPVLHVHVASGVSFWRKSLFIWMAWIAHRRIVFHLHGGGFQSFIDNLPRFQRAFALATIRRCDQILCLSSVTRNWLLQWVGNVPVSWWPNPVVAGSAEIMPTEKREPVVLYLGALTSDKGLSELIDAFARLHATDRLANLVIGGAGPELEALKKAVAERQLQDNVFFLGWIDSKEKQTWLDCARVLVLASHVEAQPMVLLEAMANGVAVVSTEVGGIPDLIEHKVHGLLVPPRDVSALSEALQTVWHDVELRQRLVASASHWVMTRHRAEVVCASLHRLYASLIKAEPT